MLTQSQTRIRYRERIVEYCDRAGIIVPKEFDAPKSSDKFVVVDETENPATLHKYSTCIKKELVAFLTDSANADRRLRVLDFKHCCELVFDDGTGKFTKGESIDCLSQEELRRVAFMKNAEP